MTPGFHTWRQSNTVTLSLCHEAKLFEKMCKPVTMHHDALSAECHRLAPLIPMIPTSLSLPSHHMMHLAEIIFMILGTWEQHVYVLPKHILCTLVQQRKQLPFVISEAIVWTSYASVCLREQALAAFLHCLASIWIHALVFSDDWEVMQGTQSTQ